jgi:hypothetical protein
MAGPWFRPKRYGWGLTPATWQGWLVTGAYVAGVIVLGATLAEHQPYVFWTLLALATAVYLLITFLTGRT